MWYPLLREVGIRVSLVRIAALVALGGSISSQSLPLPLPNSETQTITPEEEEQGRPVGIPEVNVSEFMTVDILAQNSYVTDVLHKLAIQSRRNIVPSSNVERLVSATIFGVPLYDALTGLLEPNGLGYVERGEFIFVYTAEELAEMQIGGHGAISKIIHLDYLRPIDAHDFVIHLLSPRGNIEITKDGGGEGGEGAAPALDAAAPISSGGGASSGSDTDEVYTPKQDEYALRNALIVHDEPDRIERIEAFLREIDTRPAQVLLEATIIQTTINEANAFGVDFALLSGENFTDFFDIPGTENGLGFQTGATPPDGSGFLVSDPGNTGAGNATIRAGFVGDVGVFVRALDQVTDVTLLSNPKVLTLNRQRSKVFVGTRVGYLETTVVENQVLQTVKFIDTGIVLDIRPFILRDGRVRLELSPKVSDVIFRNFESSSGNVQQIPDEEIQSVTTNVLVPEGYTAVLGGLFREDTTRIRNQVPVLGDLPLLGPLFRGHDDSTGQVEIVFLIKPTVLEDELVIEQGERGEDFGERVRVGSRLGLLPWSRERHSARLNLEAERHLAEGEVSAALWKVRRSLELFPQQPEMVGLYARLESDPLWWPSRSYMERMIDDELSTEVGEESMQPPLDREGPQDTKGSMEAQEGAASGGDEANPGDVPAEGSGEAPREQSAEEGETS